MKVSTEALSKANQNLERITATTAARQAASLSSVGRAQANLDSVTRRSTRSVQLARQRTRDLEQRIAGQIVEAEIRVATARATVAAAANKAVTTQVKANAALAASERALERIVIEGQARMAAAREGVQAARFGRREAIGGARGALSSAERREAELAAATLAAQAVAQRKVDAASKAAGRGFNLPTLALAPFKVAAQGAQTAVTALGKALIAVTGFSNRFAVALRFGAVAAAGFGAALAIGTAASFETQLAKIDNLTELTREQTDALGDSLLRLSKVIPKSPAELGSAAYFILSSGVKDTKVALDILTLSAKASVVGLGTTDQVARTVTATMNAYGKENISASQAIDILTAAVQQGSAEASDFAGALGRLLGIAPPLGIEFDQLAAALAALTNAGLDADQATTAILGIMNQLISPSKEARETIKLFGTSIEEVRKNIAEKGLLAAMQDLLGRMNNNIQAFENLFPEVRGLTGALQLFVNQSDSAASILDKVKNSEGILEAAFRRMSETFSFQAGLLKNQLNVALIETGKVILPILTREVQKLTAFIEQNKDEIRAFAEQMIQSFTKLAKAAIPGLKVLKSALDGIPESEAAVVASITAMGLAFVVAFGPASAAVAAIIGALALLGQLEAQGNNIADKLGSKSKFEDKFKRIQEAAGGRVTPETLEGIESVTGKMGDLEKKLLLGLQKEADKVESDRLKTIANRSQQEAEFAREIEKTGKSLTEINPGINDFNIGLDDAKEKILTIKDALSDLTISFDEAKELGIDALTAGAFEAAVMFNEADEAAFNFTKTLSKVANAFARSTQAANKLVLALIREGLEKSKQALAAITGQPTREVASLELAIAELEAKRAEAALSIIPQIEALQDQLDALRARRQQGTKGREGEPREPNEQILGQVLESGLNTNLGRLGTAAGESADALKEEEEAIQSQIDALQKQLETFDRQEGALQRQIDIYKTQTEILVKQAQLADKTLQTQEEQKRSLLEVIENIGKMSQATRDFSEKVGVDVIEDMDAMREAVKLATDAIGIALDESIRTKFIVAIDESALTVTEHSSAVAAATKAITDAQKKALEEQVKLSEKYAQAVKDAVEFSQEMSDAVGTIQGLSDEEFQKRRDLAGANLPAGPGFQHGGLITSPTRATLGEGSHPELVLPLSNVRRSQQLLRSLPPGLQAQLAASRGGGGSLFGDLNINGGPVPQAVENMVVFQVRRQLALTRNNLHRSGLRV